MKVLIVDDHEFFRLGVKRTLESFISHVILLEAENGRRALEVMKKEAIDLVILDIAMPAMSGFELLHHFQKNSLKTFKVIALTFYNDPAVVHQLLELGCEGYVSKNSNSANLISAVTKVLAGELSYPRELHEKMLQLIQPRFCSRTIQSDLVADLYFGHLRIIHHTIAFF
jgi:DNA-binding NarL/FixJ family response regulator